MILRLKLLKSWSDFKWGFTCFFLAIAVWIIHVFSHQGLDNYRDLWISLDLSGCVSYQQFLVLSKGYCLNTNQVVDTFPKKSDRQVSESKG